MTIRSIIQKSLWLLLVAIGLLSCADESISKIESEQNKALVKLEVRVPGGTVRSTRALQKQHEDEISQIIVFAFEKGTESNWNTKLVHISKSIGISEDRGSSKQFTVELQTGQWDLWVLANSEKVIEKLEDHIGIDIYSPEFIEVVSNKAELRILIEQNLEHKWNVDPDDSHNAYRIPMWGMVDDVQISYSSTNIIRTVNLYRMLVKIDVEIQRTKDVTHPDLYPGITMNVFELTHVSLHNYNTKGLLIPGVTAEDGNWTAPNGGAAIRTSLPLIPTGVYGWKPNERMEWSNPSDFTTPGTALEGVIYTVEANKGTDSSNHPCLIIGGKYNGSNDITYYRADFIDANGNHLDLLRNHLYKLIVRKISGRGFSTIEEAYKAGPTQLEAEIIKWSDGKHINGVWNGTHEIQLSSAEVHFNQFGISNQQEINIRTNIPTFTLGDFTDITAGQSDGAWQQIMPNNWSNGHFNISLKNTATEGEYSDYLLTITASSARNGDPIRQSTFTITGHTLQIGINISQDQYTTHQLYTFPESTTPISISGERQLIKIEVMSTHPYMINFNGYTMFTNAYQDAAGTKLLLNLFNIPASVNEVYVEVSAHNSLFMRSGEFFIRHISTESTAMPHTYQVLQTTPIISATLEDGSYDKTINKQGGSEKISVVSNLSTWYPTLTIDGVPYEGSLSSYFDIINGYQNQSVTFTIPPMSSSETRDKIYEITFKDSNSNIETQPAITITQQEKHVTPPTDGVKAFENILSVSADGELNLDGNGYVVYFKWGSLIAVTGSQEKFSATQIAWVPTEYNASTIGDSWEDIPYATSAQMPQTNPAYGIGDPCTLALKDGIKGGWMMPTTTNQSDIDNSAIWVTKTVDGIEVQGRESKDGKIFYPAAGYRTGDIGISYANVYGYYWLNSTVTNFSASHISFTKGSFSTVNQVRTVGFPIRCVQK